MKITVEHSTEAEDLYEELIDLDDSLDDDVSEALDPTIIEPGERVWQLIEILEGGTVKSWTYIRVEDRYYFFPHTHEEVIREFRKIEKDSEEYESDKKAGYRAE